MQIRNIQTIFKNNFQYKNKTNNFITRCNPSFQGVDVVEISKSIGADPDEIITSKKYYRGKQEFDPNLLSQRGERLFILNKDTYIPYGAHLEEYNAKGEVVRHTAFSNGAKFIVRKYKHGEYIQEDRYEDIFNTINMSNKRTSVIKFDGLDESGKRYNQTFEISRNWGKDWENHPAIVLRKNVKDISLTINFSSPSDDSNGSIEITHHFKGETTCFRTLIDDEKEYSLKLSPDNSENETAYLALIELKETIESEEFKAEFGDNDIFNSELNKAINYLASNLNAS